MHARDAAGRQVSLLNDDAAPSPVDYAAYSPVEYPLPQRLSYSAANHVLSQPYYRSASASPNAPHLSRSDSYDSQASSEPLSPITPSLMYPEYAQATPAVYNSSESSTPYDEHMSDAPPLKSLKRPAAFVSDGRSSSFEDESSAPSHSGVERLGGGKRYPCRYRDTHGCEKTFTTSGHASRHSKIHTAEKAVQCTHPGCNKKFTRADNMKQHLETHFKDRSRSSAASRPSVAGRRSSSSSKTSSHKRVDSGAALPSPVVSSPAWDMTPLVSRPMPLRNPSSGLDALAMAVACQEGA